MNRVDALRELAFEKRDFDAFLVASESNMLYLTGTPGATCLLISKEGKNIIYVFALNFEQTKADAKGFQIEMLKRGDKLTEKIGPEFKALKIKKLAADTMNYETYRLIAKVVRGKAKLKVESDLLWKLRKVKDEEELKRMRKAGQITVAGMRAAHETIKPGISEIAVAAEIEYAMRKNGSYGTAFETIVASGVRSAFPHGGCQNRKIRKGDLVVVDIGGTYEYYRSDMTRTFVSGKPTEKQTRLYELVRMAHEKAHQAIKAKAHGKDVDHAARKVIEQAGYGYQFNHGLGHGVGLDIHEMPVLAPNSKDKLAVGNVVTNEPGIYFPGFGGVRIEDTVNVKNRISEKFTEGFYSLETAK